MLKVFKNKAQVAGPYSQDRFWGVRDPPKVDLSDPTHSPLTLLQTPPPHFLAHFVAKSGPLSDLGVRRTPLTKGLPGGL